KEMLALKYPKAKHFFDTDRDIKKREIYYQSVAESDYLLYISYDEFITPELAKEIVHYLNSDIEFDALAMRAIDYSYGQKIINKDYFTNRVIKRGKLFYEHGNIHEELKVEGKIINLNGYYEHYTNAYLMVTVFKIFRYELINAAALTDDQ
ncbi:hypothetical protein ABQG68_19780, partial [Bacillus pumilus]|uniref:hypothetical protein n=1 Tax=Bacillus pumilus TaxID=1408 RepID=UPI0033162E63